MPSLQKALNRQMAQLPEMVLRPILARKLADERVDLPTAAVDALIDHILRQRSEIFSWTDGKTGEEPEEIRNLELVFDDTDIAELEASISKLTSEFPEIIEKVISEGADNIYKTLKERWPVEGALQNYEIWEFRERLEERWGEGLGLLRMLLACCREVGSETHKRYRRSKSKKYACRRFVLIRLHTRACQVADEIITLMDNGFADGAMARWRTLHELAVVATLIADGDETLAKRYIDHDAVEVKRQADDYDETLLPLGYPALGIRVRRKIEKEYAVAIAKYGRAFASPYGWAAERLNKKNPTFKDIQKEAGRAGMNSHYKLASFNVHAGARTMFFRMTDMGGDGALLAGRSNAGLTEPGQNTAYALLEITALLVGHVSNLDRLVELRTLIKIRDSIPRALQKADRTLRRDEAAYQRQRAKRLSRSRT